MTTFDCIDTMWTSTLADLFDRGKKSPSRIEPTLSLLGYVGRLSSISKTFLTNERRKLDPRYGAAEFLWYFNSIGSLEMISHYAPQYINFAEPNGKVNGAYGPRVMSQLEDLLEALKDQYTRRAVLGLYGNFDIIAARWAKDIPCTLSWNFLFDEGKLCLVATMRSNDAWLGMPYDIFVNTCMQRFIAANLGVPTGWYQHQVANIHIYEKHWQACEEALHSRSYPEDVFRPIEPFLSMDDVNNLLEVEECIRLGEECNPTYRFNGFFRDIKALIEGRNIESKVLEDAYNRRHGLRG
jgi:thymidylate synthase